MGILYFDAHCDTISRLVKSCSSDDLFQNSGHVDLLRSERYDARVQIFALFADDESPCKEQFMQQYSYFIKQLGKYGKKISLCRCSHDIEKALNMKKTAALLSVEGAEMLDCDIDCLKEAYTAGVRAINITWNRANLLCGSCSEESQRGLSERGKIFVDECTRLGIMIDVSHLSEKGFWDIAERISDPFIASHSNSAAVFKHKRNLSDEQFKAIVEHSGVVGINLYTDFLGDNSLESVVRHILHFLELGGENSISIGADFDGCDKLPCGIDGVEDMRKLYYALIDAGISVKIVNRIFFENMMEVVRKVCDI